MAHKWDEFSKLLAEPIPRRESLRRLGFLFAGAVLTPLGLGTAWAQDQGGTDACRSFCNKCPRSQRPGCLTACRGCNNRPSNLCGSCSSGFACTDFRSDVHHCGACSNDCWSGAGVNEEAACVNGKCVYACVQGAVDCNGTCTFLGWDSHNCGACGNVCPDAEPYCDGNGVCFDPGCAPGLTWCGGTLCVDLNWDQYNCGACGNACSQAEACLGGQCEGICVGCYYY
jgi:hypothetical protein